MKYVDDLTVGSVTECGERTVPRDELIEFAERWDPQPFHVNEEAATETIFGDVIASGIHTLAVCNVLAYDGIFGDVAIIAGKGINELRLPHPVRPGDTISAQVAVVEKDPTQGPADRGLVQFRIEGSNQREVTVLSFISLALVERKNTNSKE